MIRIILVDDEKHARERLSTMLAAHGDLEVVEMCSNGIEAIECINRENPDVLFLDVEMPEVNGFDVLNSLDQQELPHVVFITAYSEYAVKAFEVNALDYIHKPFDKARLDRALEKIRANRNSEGQKELQDKLGKFLAEKMDDEKLQRFILKSGGNIYIIKTADVLWIEASGNYINVVTEEKKFLYRSTLSGIKKKLDEDTFYQIHRSMLVNLDYVSRIEEWSYGDYKVVMKNGAELKMSRNYKELIRTF